MLDAVCDIRASTRATRLATTVDVDCYKVLSVIDGPNGASMIAGATARSYSLTARSVGVDRLRALTATARRCQNTRTQQDRSNPDALKRASRRLGSDSHTGAGAVHHKRHQPTAPGHPRGVMCRITPPEVIRC